MCVLCFVYNGFYVSDSIALCWATFGAFYALLWRIKMTDWLMAIYPFLMLISWNLTIRYLEVIDGDDIDECSTLSQPSWLLGAL